ncbi:hypothetical protein BH23PLA1_BH23PLA1_05300 [soil metagenome]
MKRTGPPEVETVEAIRDWFASDPSRMTMMAARKFEVPEQEVVEALVGHWPITRLRPGTFPAILEDFQALGPMRVFVRSKAAIMEAVGQFGGLSESGPFLNVQTETLDMHILKDQVARAYAIEKIGHDSTINTYSFQFFDPDGNAAFKAFLWDGYPDLPAPLIEQFHTLARAYRQTESAG